MAYLPSRHSQYDSPICAGSEVLLLPSAADSLSYCKVNNPVIQYKTWSAETEGSCQNMPVILQTILVCLKKTLFLSSQMTLSADGMIFHKICVTDDIGTILGRQP